MFIWFFVCNDVQIVKVNTVIVLFCSVYLKVALLNCLGVSGGVLECLETICVITKQERT